MYLVFDFFCGAQDELGQVCVQLENVGLAQKLL